MTDVAVVIGASSGIGAASAEALAAEGFHVHGVGRRADALAALADRIGGSFDVADATREDELAAVYAGLAGTYDSIRVLMYSAGVLDVHAVEGHPTELWQRSIDVNLTGAFLTVRTFLPLLVPGSRIVFVASVTGKRGQPRLSAYAASKGGLILFGESLAAELEPRGIAVHVLVPGPVRTPMLDRPAVSPYRLEPGQIADVVTWLTRLPPDVVLREVTLRAVTAGPFAAGADGTAQPME